MSTVTSAVADESGLTISTGAGELLLVAASDVRFDVVRSALLGGERDFAALRALAEGGKAELRDLVEHAVASVDGDTDGSYRMTHGDPVAQVVLDTAIRITRSGADPAPVSRFLARLDANPSPESRAQLFAWLKAEGLAVTADGLIVGYKGVSDDYRSIHAGREPVTVTPQGGEPEVQVGHITYPVGATVSMPAHLVNADRSQGCSVGLHVGTFAYARSWGQRRLMVLVDPADVVSVPMDSGNAKMRVSKLIVAMELTDDQRVPDAVVTVRDAVAVAEYQARPENTPAVSCSAGGWDSEDTDDDTDDEDVARCLECGCLLDRWGDCERCDEEDAENEDDEDDEDD